MRWNGTDITGIPTLIYHDELTNYYGSITDPNGPGRLICNTSFPLNEVNWLHPNRNGAASLGWHGPFLQKKETGLLTNIIRLSNYNEPFIAPNINPMYNGLWYCARYEDRVHVGIYGRAGSELLAAQVGQSFS